MTPDTDDTIVAIATARGGASRGAVRLSGAASLEVLAALAGGPVSAAKPRRLPNRPVRVEVGGAVRAIPADLLVWPDARSYTHQPSAEIHTIGSPPVLDAIVRACVAAGARLAEPGEFTLRAFLAGRLDLTQAEAVLSVIDARSDQRLAAALEQLAGGLSTPLHRLRADLLGLLADLEAGLDFVEEEDVRFVEPAELQRRLTVAVELVAATERQLTGRDDARRLPCVAICGPPNVGKSRLFNALVERHGVEDQPPRALVADAAGVTRDALAAVIEVDGLRLRLVDTAGDDHTEAIDAIDSAARGRLASVLDEADLLLDCRPAGGDLGNPAEGRLAVATMADRCAEADRFTGPIADGWLATSAATGTGLDRLAEAVVSRLNDGAGVSPDLTADRCRLGLAQAREALDRAAEAAAVSAGDELVSFELRQALDGLGRVVGEVVTDEVLGEIFGRFCIGK